MSPEVMFFIDFRRRLIDIIGGVDDSDDSLFWDTTTPNSKTRRTLKCFKQEASEQARGFGYLILRRHSDCGRKSHAKMSDDWDYVIEPINGQRIKFRQKGFKWHETLDQKDERCPCPCSKLKERTKHYVLEDSVFEPGADVELCRKLHRLFAHLCQAIEQSEDGRPRSAIRENLLTALLDVNEFILQKPMQVIIEEVMNEGRSGT